MRIGLITTRKKGDGQGSVMVEVAEHLSSRGHLLEPIYPDEGLLDVGNCKPEHDLYVLKAGSPAAMELAATLDAAGARILNPYNAVVKIKSKVLSSRLLSDAGVPVPDAFVVKDTRSLKPLAERGALVLKPLFGGSQGRGVRIVRSVEDLPESDGDALFVQTWHEPDGRDHKMYRIADKVFGVRRVWPARSLEDKLGEVFEPPKEMIDITLQCGDPFGVDLYGLDIIVSKGKPYVVDINSFPGFKGVPDAGRHLANYLMERL